MNSTFKMKKKDIIQASPSMENHSIAKEIANIIYVHPLFIADPIHVIHCLWDLKEHVLMVLSR